MGELVIPIHSNAAAYLRSRRKRSIDILVGIVGLIVTLMAFPFVAILIKLESRGPILYRQGRLGMDGKVFEIIKFRTMIDHAEQAGEPVWSMENDPRLTRVGLFLRRMYIDEFPQFWNVVRGDMSVVGPRPERVALAGRVSDRVPNFSMRLQAKPGMTGLAQTQLGYINTINDSRHKLTYDIRYIAAASFRLDSWLMMRTLSRMILKRGT